MNSSKKGDKDKSSYFGDCGETEHPCSLQDTCLAYLCNNLNEICVTKTVVVTPKRRKVNSGSSQSFVDEVESSATDVQLNSYQNAHSIGNEKNDEGVDPAISVSPSSKPILPRMSEELFEADSRKNRPNSSTEGKIFL